MNQSFFYVRDHGITTEDIYPYKGYSLPLCKYNDQTDKKWTISDCVQVLTNN